MVLLHYFQEIIFCASILNVNVFQDFILYVLFSLIVHFLDDLKHPQDFNDRLYADDS